MPDVTRTAIVPAPPEQVWDVISDLPGMGSLSPEASGGTWDDEAAPALGSTFTGSNAREGRSWTTKAKVTSCERGRAFAFDVTVKGLQVAAWGFLLEPVEGGTQVTQTFTDRRGVVVKGLGRAVTKVKDREEHNGRTMEATLAALQQRFATAG